MAGRPSKEPHFSELPASPVGRGTPEQRCAECRPQRTATAHGLPQALPKSAVWRGEGAPVTANRPPC